MPRRLFPAVMVVVVVLDEGKPMPPPMRLDALLPFEAERMPLAEAAVAEPPLLMALRVESESMKGWTGPLETVGPGGSLFRKSARSDVPVLGLGFGAGADAVVLLPVAEGAVDVTDVVTPEKALGGGTVLVNGPLALPGNAVSSSSCSPNSSSSSSSSGMA